jgi:phospho-N-acetylmuramoyl-pentapeptide-transferase
VLDALFAACLAMVVTLVLGRPLITELRRRKLGKSADVDAPEVYASKAGTPTMGGLMFLAGLTLATLVFGVTENSDTLIPLGAMIAVAGPALFDDFQTLIGSGKLSGHERWFWLVKWGVLLAIGIAVAAVLYFHLDLDDAVLPHFGAYSLDLLYLPVVVIVFVVGTSGIVITDGMDGLMAGVSALAYAAYGAIALSQGQEALGAFAFSVVGATAAFLWFNSNPAQVFMGEVGSQPLAVGLVVLAFMTG